MGLKEWFKAERPKQLWLKDGLLHLYGDRIINITAKKEAHPLAGVSAHVESGSDTQRRTTLTRVLVLSLPVALLAKKKTGGEVYLNIEGPDFFWTLEVPRDKRQEATKFAAAINQQARQAEACTTP